MTVICMRVHSPSERAIALPDRVTISATLTAPSFSFWRSLYYLARLGAVPLLGALGARRGRLDPDLRVLSVSQTSTRPSDLMIGC